MKRMNLKTTKTSNWNMTDPRTEKLEPQWEQTKAKFILVF